LGHYKILDLKFSFSFVISKPLLELHDYDQQVGFGYEDHYILPLKIGH
jgi:hypothetical protein